MKYAEMVPGAFYQVRGGYILRYLGPFGGGTGPRVGCNGAFGPVRDEDLTPIGACINLEDVLTRVTAETPWLMDRRAMAAARKLVEDVADMDYIAGGRN